MTQKSEAKKQYILETARKVFADKGYKDVTMKDIVEACDISRGGLYLYFGSTEEIFLEILKEDTEGSDSAFEEAIRGKTSAEEILQLFLEEQKKELLAEDDTLSVATYEYGFSKKDESFLRAKFNEATRVIEYLIRLGCRQKKFHCRNAHKMAVNVMFLIEGLKISARTIRVTGEEVDDEIAFILEELRGS